MNEFLTTYCPHCGDLDLTGVDDRNVMISSLCEETGEIREGLPVVVETAHVRLDEGEGARGCDCGARVPCVAILGHE